MNRNALLPLPALAALVLLAVTFAAPAATNYWLGGSGNYTNAANWSLGVVPGKSDAVFFTNNTTYAVTFTSGVDPTFYNTAGSVTLSADVLTSSPFVITAGQNISAGASVTIDTTSSTGVGGNLLLIAGFNFSTVNIAAGAALTANNSALTVTGTAVNGGNINLSGGVTTLQSGINNSGTFSGGGINLVAYGGVSNNGGTINLTSGSANITGGLINSGGFSAGDGGTVSISADSVVNSGTLRTFGGGSLSTSGLLNNSGSVGMSGGTINVNSVSTSGDITIAGDINVSGGGGGGSLNATGTGGFSLSAGSGGSAGSLTVNAGGSVSVAGPVLAAGGGTTVNITGGTLSANGGGSFGGGGTVNIGGGGVAFFGGGGGVGITNQGAINIAGSLTVNGSVTNGNTGSISATNGGTLNITGGFMSSGLFGTRLATVFVNMPQGMSVFVPQTTILTGPTAFYSGTASFGGDTIIQRPGEDLGLGPTVPTEILSLNLISTTVTTSFFDTGNNNTTFVGRTNVNAGPVNFLMSGAGNYPYFGGYLCLGAGGGSNTLVITNGAKPAIASYTTLGLTAASANNLLRVTGTGSRLDIYNGGLEIGRGSTGNVVVVDRGGFLSTAGTALIGSPYAGPTANNSVTVDGANSKWTNQNTIVVGAGAGTNNNLAITNGGLVRAPSFIIGNQAGAFSSGVSVAAGDATMDGISDIIVGAGASSSTVWVGVGGTVRAGSNLTVGQASGSSNNTVLLSGGTLIVTNASTNATIDVRRGNLIINGGNVTADSLMITNGTNSSISFNSGTLQVRSLIITNSPPLVVGDGTNASRLLFLPPCNASLVSLTIRSHGMCAGGSGSEYSLKITGEFGDGTVTNGGTISPGQSAGVLRFTGNLLQQPGGALEFDIGGVTQGTQYDLLAFSGSVVFDGSLRIARLNNFTPAAGDSFTLMTFASGSGAFANVASGARLKTVDNLGSYLITLTSTSLVASAYATLDADGDGIEDAWALQYFGHSPLTTAEKNADADGDGMSNYAEFIAGTDPTNPNSVFRAAGSLDPLTRAPALRFNCVAGKRYRVFYTDNLGSFTEVLSPAFTFPAADVCQWADDGSATGGAPASGRRFYQLAVE